MVRLSNSELGSVSCCKESVFTQISLLQQSKSMVHMLWYEMYAVVSMVGGRQLVLTVLLMERELE